MVIGIILTLCPVSSLWAEEIIGREVSNFSGTLNNGVVAKHRVYAGSKGTMNLTLSFVGGNSSIQLDVIDGQNQSVYSKQILMANKIAVHLEAGGYIIRLTPILKNREDLPYQLEALMPRTTYITMEEEKVPLAAPDAETPAATFKPIPFKAYIIFLLMLLWGWLSVYLYRFLTKRERRK